MGKIYKFLTWLSAALPPLTPPTSAERAVRTVTARAIKVDDALRAPHYYVFGYQGRKQPKAYMGPFDSRAAAKAYVRDEVAHYARGYSKIDREKLRRDYKIKHLTSDQFDMLWGAPPHPDGDRRI